jgi:protein gp37
MSDGTAIEWTDATWNPIIGCSVVSPGCTNCYAMRLAGTRLRNHPTREGLTIDTKAGPVWNGQVRLREDELRAPLRWMRPREIFVCAHADLFADQVPDAWIDRIYAIMVRAPQHAFQVLTKRAARMQSVLQRMYDLVVGWQRERAEGDGLVQGATTALRGAFPALYEALWSLVQKKDERWQVWPLPNVWQGVSVEDQVRADERIPILLQTPAAVRWISAEPLLGPLHCGRVFEDGKRMQDYLTGRTGVMYPDGPDFDTGPALDWVVAGGESGPGSRPMHPEWVKRIRDDCAAAEVPFLFKQWGNWLAIGQMAPGASDDLYHPPPVRDPEAIRRCKVANTVLNRDGYRPGLRDPRQYRVVDGSMMMFEVGKKVAGRLLDGVEHNGMPGTAA